MRDGRIALLWRLRFRHPGTAHWLLALNALILEPSASLLAWLSLAAANVLRQCLVAPVWQV